MAKEFLGKGWHFPVEVDRQGGIALSTYEENIRECIYIILGTAPGERVMQPLFGCEIHELLFEPNNVNTCGLAAFYAIEALEKWEPRITDVDASARSAPGEPHKILIEISYKVRETNQARNMVYPFYLRTGEEQA